MKSDGFPTEEQVLKSLGDDLLRCLVIAVDGARDDYQQFRAEHPGWAADQTQRGSANFIHDRLWAHLRRRLDGWPGVTFHEQGSTREFAVGMAYVFRVKRHSLTDAIRSYPTETALVFWNGSAPALEGMERWNLALGYRWDAEAKVFGEAVLSFRTEMGDPVWVVEPARPQAADVTPWRRPSGPSRPDIDLSSVLPEIAEEDRA